MKKNNIREFLLERAADLEKEQNCKARTIQDCLLTLKFEDDHIHHLLPHSTNERDLIEDLISSLNLDFSTKKEKEVEPKPVILRNRQAVGDILMMTAGIRDMKEAFPHWPINVSTTAMHIWDNNPHLDRSLTKDNAEIVDIGPGFLTNASNRDDRHFANAFRLSIEDKLGISIKQGAIKPDIWMTDEEIKEPIVKPPYWIIVAGEKGDWTAKTYPFDRWQRIIKKLNHVKFVQIGAKEHRHPVLDGDNVINMIGKTQDRNTGIRDLFRLFYFAEGSMGLVSFQMHLAAAFSMPCLVIAGAREPARFTRYPGHQYLCTDGCLPCASAGACWHCDLEKTCPVIVTGESEQRYPKCVDIISEEDVMRAFFQFYDGERLSFDHPRTPVFPNAIVKESEEQKRVFKLMPRNTPKPELTNGIAKTKLDGLNPEDFGFHWNGACITEKDWIFLRKILEQYKIKTVLEFGTGLSTVMMAAYGIKILTYETDEKWVKDLKKKEIDKACDLRTWNGVVMQDKLGRFDLAIVDGPPGGRSREFSTKIASRHADIVLVHDAGREWERKWQAKYLEGGFIGPGKGGNRWHLWAKKKVKERSEAIPEPSPATSYPKPMPTYALSDTKVFRLFCNTRGDGGCARSIDWFMNAFLNLGWNVEYVFSNPQPSGTYRRCGNPKVLATNSLDILGKPCDIFMLASDDFVWEFGKPSVQEMLGGVNAKRKVMYINYRIGNIGAIKWTQGWDKYLFLNSSLRDAFLQHYVKNSDVDPETIKTKVLAPPTDLTLYFKNVIDYTGGIRIVRHSSQGNSKYSTDFNYKVVKILETFPEATIRLMPGPTFLNGFGDKVRVHKRNSPPVHDFLQLGNVFWYDLPDGYTEGGPKVILEAMASGLPVIAGNHSGPKDRVVPGTGYLCDSFTDVIEALNDLDDLSVRRQYGEAARKHAKENFKPELWVKEIVEDEESGDI